MIRIDGKVVRVDYSKKNPKEVEAASLWAKGACDRIFSHYTKDELQYMRGE